VRFPYLAPRLDFGLQLRSGVFLRKTPLLFEFSLCLSRACLGKKIVFIYNWRKEWRFSHRVNQQRIDDIPAPEGGSIHLCHK
jgi:hypothetical protein